MRRGEEVRKESRFETMISRLFPLRFLLKKTKKKTWKGEKKEEENEDQITFGRRGGGASLLMLSTPC